jgi:type VI protein secretion system component VasF
VLNDRMGLALRQAWPGTSGRRRALWRELTWLLALKFVALFVLWFLFFSPSHRSPVDSETTRRRFALDHAARVAVRGPRLSHEGDASVQKGEAQ